MDTLFKTTRKFLRAAVPPEYLQDYNKELLTDNYLRLSIVSVILFIVELALFYPQEHLFGNGIIILIFLAISGVLIPLIFYIKRHIPDISFKFAMAVMYAYIVLALLLGAMLTLVVVRNIDMTHVYLLTVLGTSMVLYTRPVPRAVTFLTVYALFAVLLPYFGASPEQLAAQRINALIFNFIAWFFGQISLYTKSSVYISRRQLDDKNRILKDLALKDTMTGLYDHAASLNMLEDEIALANLTHSPLTLIMADIDDFKRINDTYGHQFGDDVISRVAAVFVMVIADAGIVGRYGGEEFIIILPGSGLEEARALAMDIQIALGRAISQPHVTLSGGISRYNGESMNDFVRITDEKLYLAKNNGKRRFVSL